MLVCKIKVIHEDEESYIAELPTKHSEKWFFAITDDFEEAESFPYSELEEIFEYMDIDWIEKCWEEKYGGEPRLKVEFVLTLSRGT